MKVGLNRYITDSSLPQKDGVNLAHENITGLMSDICHEEIDVEFHDFNELLRSDIDTVRIRLKDLDCIISNVGPHAHYYFWLREKCGLSFRIIRDVRTAIWSSYLLQEYLIAPLLRANDTLLVASYYTQAIYHKFFPHLRKSISIKCYPLTASFPHNDLINGKRYPLDGSFTIGYIGRLSEDKNFPQLIDLIISLNKRGQKKYRLVACGDVHSNSCEPNEIINRLKCSLGEGDFFIYEDARPHDQIWSLLFSFDLMIFPSTSNLETFGRVLVEASYAKVPVIAADHAAACELVPTQNLCDVTYNTNDNFSAHFDHCLGQIKTEDVESKILNDKVQVSDCFEAFKTHTDLFVNLLKVADYETLLKMTQDPNLSRNQMKFIDRIRCSLPEPLTKSLVMEKIQHIASWFIDLQDPNPLFKKIAVQKLLTLSCHRERSARFSMKHMQTQGNYTNVGGIDIELCHVLKFYPSFHIENL